MNFENLNETTKIRLRNNGINSDEDLINQLLDRIVELEEGENNGLSKLNEKIKEISERLDNASVDISIETVSADLDI